MKQGIKYNLPVTFNGLDMSKVSKIRIKFQQFANSLIFDYPGTNTTRSGNVIVTSWTQAQTFTFKPGTVALDAVVTLSDGTQPQTTIDRFEMKPTLFTRSEVTTNA